MRIVLFSSFIQRSPRRVASCTRQRSIAFCEGYYYYLASVAGFDNAVIVK
jgi:hypothetical protein